MFAGLSQDVSRTGGQAAEYCGCHGVLGFTRIKAREDGCEDLVEISFHMTTKVVFAPGLTTASIVINWPVNVLRLAYAQIT